MPNTLGIVEVRANSELLRLAVCRKLGGKSVLEWVVRGLTESLRLSEVIVLAPKIATLTELAELVPHDISLVVSDRKDALGRFAHCLDRHPAQAIVRVAAEHPFVDPVLIDRLVNTAVKNSDADYIGFCSRNGKPAMMSPLGVIGEWIRSSALLHAERKATDGRQREQVTGYLHAHPEQFKLRLIPIPAELDRDDVRLTIGGEEDWEHTQSIFEALGPDVWDYQRIGDLLTHQPALRERMAMLNRTVGAA